MKEMGQKARARKCTQATTSMLVVDVEVQRLLKELLASLRDLGAYRPTKVLPEVLILTGITQVQT